MPVAGALRQTVFSTQESKGAHSILPHVLAVIFLSSKQNSRPLSFAGHLGCSRVWGAVYTVPNCDSQGLVADGTVPSADCTGGSLPDGTVVSHVIFGQYGELVADIRSRSSHVCVIAFR